jgi:hypothetical protein
MGEIQNTLEGFVSLMGRQSDRKGAGNAVWNAVKRKASQELLSHDSCIFCEID